MVKPRIAALAVPLFLLTGHIAGAEPSRFQDWIVDCDSAGYCSAATMSLADGGGRRGHILKLERGAEPDRTLALGFDVAGPGPDPKRALQWRVDGAAATVLRPDRVAPFGRAESWYITDGALGTDLLAGLSAGSRLRISWLDALGAPHDADFSLLGISAALAELDARQGRDAVRAVAPPEDLATITTPTKQEAVAAFGVPEPVLYRHAAESACEDPTGQHLAGHPPIVAALSEVATLYAVPCTVGAGGVTYRLYLRDSGEIGGLETLYFALYDPRYGWIGTDLLGKITVDPSDSTLRATSTGPSDRQCGYEATWRWIDYAFRLERFLAPENCAAANAPARWKQVFP